MKSKFLFLISGVFLVFLLSSISAVVVYGDWEDSSQTVQITSGQSIDFNADFFSMSPPMTVNIKLYNSSGALVHSFESNTVVNGNGFAETYTITPAIYSTTGNFELILSSSDAFPSSDSHTLFLEVRPQPPSNNPPVITSTPVTSVNESTSYIYDANATDADNDTLTYSLTQAPSWLTINSATGLISGTAPAVSSNTDFEITVTVSDGKDSVNQAYTLTVVNVNNLPVITSNPVNSINENEAYSYQLIATDADGEALTYNITGLDWLSISGSGLVTGNAPDIGSDTDFDVIITVSDGIGSAIQSYVLTVVNVPEPNNPPVITSEPIIQINENANYSYQITATDTDGDALIYSMTGPTWLSVGSSGLVLGTSLAVNTDTNFDVTIIVDDGNGGTDSQTYILIVKDIPPPTNLPPKKDSDIKKRDFTNMAILPQDKFYEMKYLEQINAPEVKVSNLQTIGTSIESSSKNLEVETTAIGLAPLALIVLNIIVMILIVLTITSTGEKIESNLR